MGNKNKVLLKDICNVITKGTTPSQFSEKGINFIRIENINGLNIDSNFDMFISEKIHNTDLKRSILKKNDILFAIAGATVGKCAIVNEDCLPANTNQALAIIRLKNNYDSFYIANILASEKMKKYIYLNISVGAQPNLSLEQVGNFQFYVDDIATQTKIATFLNLYYKKIELLNKKLNLLKLRKEGFLQRVFRKQYPNIYKLNAILKERSIYSSDKQMYTHATLSKDGIFPKTERYNRDFLVKDEEKKYKITFKNDICYNPANLKFGVICLNNYGTLIFSPIYVTFEINTNLTDVTYISHLLTWNETIQKLRKYEEGTVYERMAVSSEDFVKLTITLPTIQEQKNISQKILSFDKEIDLISNKINLLEKYKQGLLQKLFI